MSSTQQTVVSSGSAASMRKAKQVEAESIGIDRPFISAMVEGFYASVRTDPLLGPIFENRIADWPEHLARMKRFWRSVLHNSGEFSGNPMAKHIAIPGLDEAHFERWLELFYANLRSLAATSQATRSISERARMIAESLLTGIAVDRDGIGGAGLKRNLPHV